MKTHVYTLFALIFFVSNLSAQSQKDEFSKWRLSLSGGYSNVLKGTSDYKDFLINNGNDPSAAQDYCDQLKSGFNAGADLHYFLRKNFGVGLKYSYFQRKTQADVFLDPYDMLYKQYGNLENNSYVNYVGPSLMYRNWFDKQEKFQFVISMSGGYANLREEYEMFYTTALITSKAFGATAGIGFEYMINKNISAGLFASYYYTDFGNLTYKTSQVKYSNNGGQKVNLSRLDFGLNITLYK